MIFVWLFRAVFVQQFGGVSEILEMDAIQRGIFLSGVEDGGFHAVRGELDEFLQVIGEIRRKVIAALISTGMSCWPQWITKSTSWRPCIR